MNITRLQDYLSTRANHDDIMAKYANPAFGIGCRARKQIRKIVLHWTGGDNPPIQVFRTLCQRNLGVHYVVGIDGNVWSSHDPKLWVAYHAGFVNEDSIGIEIVSPGTGRGKAVYSRPTIREFIHGRRHVYLGFYDEQLAAVKELILYLLAEFPTIERRVPLAADGSILATEMPRKEMEAFSGICGHLHVTKHKVDPGVQIFHDVVEWISEGDDGSVSSRSAL